MRKYRKLFKAVFVFVILVLINISSVNALELTKGDALYTYNGNHLYQKSVGDKAAFCISGISVFAGNTGDDCTLEGSEDTALGYIIYNGYKNNTDSYIITETAVMQYSGVSDYKPVNEIEGRNLQQSDVEKLVDDARNSNKNNYSAIKDSTFDAQMSVRNLVFSKSGDKFISQNISISGINYIDGDPTIEVTGVVGANVVGNYESFHIEIPASNVTEKVNVTVAVNATQKSYYTASIYYCGDSSNQKLAVLNDGVQRTTTASVSGTVSPGLIINKVDENGDELKGATLKLCRDKDCTDLVDTWSTSTHELNDIEDGTYYLFESTTPDGYNSISFIELKIANGLIDGESSSYDVKNEKTRTIISKKSATDNKELAGATLQILDKDKKNISCIIVNSEGKEEELDECKWVSSENPTTVLGLKKGTYYLKEINAPEGYVLSEALVEFTIKDDSSTSKIEMLNDIEVKVPDTLSAKSTLLLTVAMFDIALGIGIINYVKKGKIKE